MRTSRLISATGLFLVAVVLFAFNLLLTTDYITIYQDDTEVEVGSEEQEIQIRRAKFAIRFSSKRYNSSKEQFYAAQIAAFLDKSELSKINEGMSTEDISCFEPGSGMATGSNGFYESIIFNNAGHHYLYFENKKERRVNLISENNGILRLEFPITKLYINEKDVTLEQADVSEFYLAILIDRNLNNVIDKGEVTKLTIKIK
jgi:hypothetical protein